MLLQLLMRMLLLLLLLACRFYNALRPLMPMLIAAILPL